MKKRYYYLFMLLIIMQPLSIPAWTIETHAATSGGGSGTIEDPYIILTAQELSDIRNDLSAHYKLGADIDLEGYDHDDDGKGWMPIGDHVSNFTGTLDGNGYVIRNMSINRPDRELVGLFGRVVGVNSELNNIRLLDVYEQGMDNVGSIAGNLTDGTVRNSYATGIIQATGTNIGGLVGVNAKGKILNSFAVVNVSGGTRVGGLVGTSQGLIQNSYASGNVNGYSEIGGLAGYNLTSGGGGEIHHSYSTGSVNGGSSVGGLAGRNESSAVQASYWNTDTSGQSVSAAGTGISSESMKGTNMFTDWDTTVWGFREGEIYPYLRAFHMGIGIDPLAALTYNLHPGQDALSVTGNVYHERSGEQITVKYVIRNSANVIVTEATNNLISDGNGSLSINRKFPLAGWSNNDYTVAITAEDSRNTAVGAMLAFTVDESAPLPPSVSFGMNGNETWSQSASTAVTVSDSGGGIDMATLQYTWSIDEVTPGPGADWTIFTNGDTLVKDDAHGDWYLHIQVKDMAGNPTNLVTNRFRLDASPAVLKGLTLSTSTLSPVFAENVFDYAVSVGNGESVFTVIPTAAYASDTITVSVNSGTSHAVPSGTESERLALNVGSNVITIEVLALNGLHHTYIVTVNRAAPPSHGDGSILLPVVMKPFIDLNGDRLDPAVIDATKPSVTLEVTPKDNTAYVSIPASVLTDLSVQNANFLLEIKTPYGSYQVPVNLASLIPGLTDLLASNSLKAEETSFKITLTDKSSDKEILAALARSLPNGKVTGALVDFHMEIIHTKTGKAIGTAEQFSMALTRIIPLPQNITEMPEQWGAFRYNETMEKFEFVPALAVKINNTWYSMIRSYSNSVYVVAQNPVSFADTQQHWGMSYIELAAAKGLVDGIGGGRYAPDQSVTRAEFTAMLVRALGQDGLAGGTVLYNDVKPDEWYFNEVVQAKELGLLDFVRGTRFKPDQPLTREEMASMVAAVIRHEKLPTTKDFVSLNKYKDFGSLDEAYLEDVRLMVKLNIMTGTGEDSFSPKGKTTRAQAAVVFIRTLQELGMID